MANIKGTHRVDDLFGTEFDDTIAGRQGSDRLFGGGGIDLLQGNRGNDTIEIGAFGTAMGGVGNDQLVGDGATMGGGPGNDLMFGFGSDLYGDNLPGERAGRGGDDVLISNLQLGSDVVRQTGGGGSDAFVTSMFAEGAASVVEVTDFRSGVDKVAVSLMYTDWNSIDQITVFNVLDTGHDGVLGNDIPLDVNSAVTVDDVGLTIRIHEDTLVIHGIDYLTRADWADVF